MGNEQPHRTRPILRAVVASLQPPETVGSWHTTEKVANVASSKGIDFVAIGKDRSEVGPQEGPEVAKK
jgi:hypothetical protein